MGHEIIIHLSTVHPFNIDSESHAHRGHLAPPPPSPAGPFAPSLSHNFDIDAASTFIELIEIPLMSPALILLGVSQNSDDAVEISSRNEF